MSIKILENESLVNIQPFLRWAGAKNWLIKKGLTSYFPQAFNNYFEPFLGSGAIFFHLNPQNVSYLSDLNPALINTYIQIRDNANKVFSYLIKFTNTEEEYYKIRNKIYLDPIQQAAQFIFLNKTSFNGIYRVNSQGEYNVPYGHRKNMSINSLEYFLKIQQRLKSAVIENTDFEIALQKVQEKDLIFLDPPYTVMHSNNGFIEYNQKIFSWEDQKRLSKIIHDIIDKKAYFVMTNAAHNSIKKLYANCGTVYEEKRWSTVGGKNAKREMISEYIFTNIN